jgi:hypothetical protein
MAGDLLCFIVELGWGIDWLEADDSVVYTWVGTEWNFSGKNQFFMYNHWFSPARTIFFVHCWFSPGTTYCFCFPSYSQTVLSVCAKLPCCFAASRVIKQVSTRPGPFVSIHRSVWWTWPWWTALSSSPEFFFPRPVRSLSKPISLIRLSWEYIKKKNSDHPVPPLPSSAAMLAWVVEWVKLGSPS